MFILRANPPGNKPFSFQSKPQFAIQIHLMCLLLKLLFAVS